MTLVNPGGQDVQVRISCTVDTAIAISTQYQVPARAFKVTVLTHVRQKAGEASESDGQFGGWYSWVKSADLADEGSVGIPASLLKEGLGPFDTGMYAAEQAAFALLEHIKRP